MIRNFNKYTYPSITRVNSSGPRLYKTPEDGLVPSVTTILSKTKDMTHLENWKNRVGEKNAERIRNAAASVGTSMHLFLESHILEKKRKCDFSPTHSKAKKMSDVIVREGLKYVDEIWGTELQLYYEDKYAGTTDVVGVYKGNECIMDFKQTNKPKRREWIGDYFLQLCACAHAHNKVHGTEIKSGVVLMCSRDYQVQTFELHTDHFYHFSEKWFERLEKFYDLGLFRTTQS